MLIIVEGPDGCGKSTLANLLAERFRCPLYKPAGSPLTGEMSVGQSQAEDRGAVGVAVHAAHRMDMVMDRWFPSEYVYGVTFGREFNDDLILQLDRQVAEVPHVVLYFDSPLVADAEWLESRGVGDITVEQWDSLRTEYQQYRKRSMMQWRPLHKSTPAGHLEVATSAIMYGRAVSHGWSM